MAIDWVLFETIRWLVATDCGYESAFSGGGPLTFGAALAV